MHSRTLTTALFVGLSATGPGTASAQTTPAQSDARIYEIVDAVSAERLERDIRALAGFGTRSTLSDTLSEMRGIGAARRWIKSEMDAISAACDGCLEVSFEGALVPGSERGRIREDTWVVNVMAIQRGTVHPNRYIVMSGDIDSRPSDATDGVADAPGANDNASGMAGVIEAARVLTRYGFPSSIVYLGLSGEEQGLFGGQHVAGLAAERGWDVVGVLNNDMIGNIEGVDGVIENNTFRVFSEPTPVTDDLEAHRRRRTTGGEVDGPSRQIARYVARIADEYVSNLDAIMIYRLDRFGRGGHHRPFNDRGFPGVRIMETHEYYPRQHQDVRVENGIEYGDVIEGVNFDYAAKLTAVNAATMASIAWAPPAPANVAIGGAVRASAFLVWDRVEHPDLAGYKVYWRDTTAPQWQHARFVGDVGEHTFEGLVIDNYLFGVASVAENGNESPVAFPNDVAPRRR